MAFNKKIKNKNIGYFLVKRRVFNKLSQAELYCGKHNLDVNDHIRSESPEIFEQAKEICHNVLPVLYEIREQISNAWDKEAEAYRKKIADYKESLTKRDLLRDYKHEQVHKHLGVLNGIADVREIINRQIEVHREVKSIYSLRHSWKESEVGEP